MDKEHIAPFLLLIRIGLRTERADEKTFAGCFPTDTDKDTVWKELRTVACKQGVACLVLDGLQALKDAGAASDGLMPSRTELMQWVSHTSIVERNHKRQETVIAKLSRFYASHGIRMMVLKGCGLSLAYPIANHRPCGDVDIWLFGEQERGDKLLVEEQGIAIDAGHHHHTIFCIDGVTVENHYDFLNAESHLSNREIERELHKQIGENCPKVSISDAEIYLPPVNFNALFLLRHAGQHFAAMEITLRHVTDWAMFVAHHHEEIDWNWLEQVAKRQNMLRFLHCLNGICVDCLGIPEDCFPLWERDKILERRILDDILNPRFDDKSALNKGFLKSWYYRIKRWWGQRWKHNLVYRESMTVSFLVLLRSHFVKPKHI